MVHVKGDTKLYIIMALGILYNVIVAALVYHFDNPLYILNVLCALWLAGLIIWYWGT